MKRQVTNLSVKNRACEYDNDLGEITYGHIKKEVLKTKNKSSATKATTVTRPKN